MLENLRKLLRRPAPPCVHPSPLDDCFADQVVVTCPACGEVWISGLPDWSPVPAPPPEEP